METLIVICLVIVIFLLLRDKAPFKKQTAMREPKENVKPQLTDIMGLPKPVVRLLMTNKATGRPLENSENEPDNFVPEIEIDGYDLKVPQEEPDEVFRNVPDLEEEEEEWNGYREYSEEDGFATGVTFEELGTVGMLLQQDKLELSKQKEAVEIVRKIQGTELFSLLEGSLENASIKIARLLDSSISHESNPGSSDLRNKDLNDFNIGEFV
jgi:hypothetical protein